MKLVKCHPSSSWRLPSLLLAVLIVFTSHEAAVWCQDEWLPQQNNIEIASTADQDNTNPHLQLECEICHMTAPASQATRSEATLIKGANTSVELCNQCHGDFNLHPVMVDPEKSEKNIQVPAYLPLGFLGKENGRIVCVSCHDIHMQGSLNKLLRGLPSQAGEDTLFSERSQLCQACHGKELTGESPHSQSDRSCYYCHLTDPTMMDKDKNTNIRSDLLKLCHFCHEKINSDHLNANNPLNDKKIQDQVQAANLPLDKEGNTNCLTCHDEHSNNKPHHYLRKSFIQLAEKSRSFDPHDTGSFCLSCHKLNPLTTPQITYKFDGNFVKVCNWCHATEGALADIHPVNVVPDKVEVKEDVFPLQEGKVTCITCHDHRCQAREITPDGVALNPGFLRGGPYDNRSSICYECHPKTSRFDVHDQINDEGELVTKTCDYCHLNNPSEQGIDGWNRVLEFTTKMTFLCTRCHQDSAHPASYLHIVQPPEQILKSIHIYEIENSYATPLDADGKITCASCHNPHERGVIKRKAASYGADEANRKRMPFICPACHTGEAGKGAEH